MKNLLDNPSFWLRLVVGVVVAYWLFGFVAPQMDPEDVTELGVMRIDASRFTVTTEDEWADRWATRLATALSKQDGGTRNLYETEGGPWVTLVLPWGRDVTFGWLGGGGVRVWATGWHTRDYHSGPLVEALSAFVRNDRVQAPARSQPRDEGTEE